MPTRSTVCALCESRCGVLVDVEGEVVRAIRPDPEHPVSRGHGCVKGLQFQRVHHHPDRVRRPRVDGQELGWEAALAALGGRLRAVVDRHGPDAVGLYSGNAAGHSLGAVLGVAALQRALGTTRHYSCLTLDNAPQFVVFEEVLGAAMRTFAADFGRSDAICLVGTDPLSSQCSQAQSNPRGVGHLRAAGKAGRLWVVDPRASATARAGRHLASRPGSDVALLAWLLGQALQTDRRIGGVREGDWDTLERAVAPWTLDRVVAHTGVERSALEALRDGLLQAERPLVWSGLGVLLGGEGTVGFWLTLCLQAALGGLGTAGGWALPVGFDLATVGRWLGLKARDPSVIGRSGHPAILDSLPAADLAEDARSGALRALVVVGGNPLLALPDRVRAEEGLRALDLLVSLDLFVNDTGALAHGVLPVRSWLARDDLPLHLAGQRWADGEPAPPRFEPAVVGPVGEARGDLEILVGLAWAAGLRPFGSRAADWALRTGVDPLTVAAGLGRALGGGRPRLTHHRDGTVHLAVPELVAALEGLAAAPEPEPGLQLVSSIRPVETLNHWMHGGRAARRREPVARVHPDTLASAGLAPGPGRLRAEGGREDQAVDVELVADPTLRPGVVALPFGWGHGPGAVDRGGVSVNRVIGSTELERFTGQPRSNGQSVRLEPVDPDSMGG